MGAGLSQQQINRRIRYRLQALAAKIRLAGGSAKYANYCTTGQLNGKKVEIVYRVLRASNGEVAGLPKVFIDDREYPNAGFNVMEFLEKATRALQ